MKAELLDYIAAHSAPRRKLPSDWAWDAGFLVVGEPTRDEVVSRLLATPGMEVLLDGKWHDVLQVADLIGMEMALRLMIVGAHLKMFDVTTPHPLALAFRAIGRFKPMHGKQPFDPIKRFAHVSG